jgi:hypothetical protein
MVQATYANVLTRPLTPSPPSAPPPPPRAHVLPTSSFALNVFPHGSWKGMLFAPVPALRATADAASAASWAALAAALDAAACASAVLQLRATLPSVVSCDSSRYTWYSTCSQAHLCAITCAQENLPTVTGSAKNVLNQ